MSARGFLLEAVRAWQGMRVSFVTLDWSWEAVRGVFASDARTLALIDREYLKRRIDDVRKFSRRSLDEVRKFW